jgi:hypothetical protein
MDREGYLLRFQQRCARLGRDFGQALEGADQTSLEADLSLPWFDVRMTVREGLGQVLIHSPQRRSQVLSWLCTRGVEVPDVDYVMVLSERR